MPRPVTKVCNQPGCPQLQPCPTHKPKPWAGSTRAARLPRNWPTIRARILKRDGYRCYLCGALADQVDHKQRGDNHSEHNLAAICGPCHRRKSGQEGNRGWGSTARRGSENR